MSTANSATFMFAIVSEANNEYTQSHNILRMAPNAIEMSLLVTA